MQRLALSCALTAVASCASGNVASELAKPPAFAPKDETQCAVIPSRTKPLVVEWPSADRGELEARVRGQGLVVVEYSGCHMRVLDRCSAGASYSYAPITKKTDHVVMRDTDDLYANVPVGAAKLEGTLKKAGQLDVEMTMVGRWEGQAPVLRTDQLTGSCDGATHVMTAVTVGAFTFTAGADAEIGGEAKAFGAGAGAKSTARRETLSSDGNEHACEKATMGDRAPPDECGALIRVEVVPLVPKNPFVGRWSCSGRAVIRDAAGHFETANVPASTRQVTDNGDGTVTVVSEGPVACPHKLAVSGTSATVTQPYTCQSGRASVTATSGSETVVDGTIQLSTSATGLVDGTKTFTTTSTGTCTRIGP